MVFEQNLIKAIKIGLYGVLLTPLFFHRSFIFPFIAPKVFVFQSLVEIIFALWLGLAIFYREYRPRLSFITLAFGIFLGILTVSSFFGIDFHRSFWSTPERALGLFALFHFAALFLVLSSIPINWRRYFTFSLAVSFIAALFAVIQLTFPLLFLEKASDRPGSFLGNPTFLAAYLLFHIFIGLWLVVKQYKEVPLPNIRKWGFLRLKPILIFIVILFEILVIFLTQTRGALLGLMVGFLALFIYFAIYGGSTSIVGRLNIRKLSIGFLAFILFFGGIFWFTRTADIWQSIPVLKRIADVNLSDATAGGLLPRFIALKISWQSFLDRPFLGWGFENFKYPFDKHYDPRLLRSGFTETYFDKPHNVFMEYLVTGGALTFLSYLVLIAIIFYHLLKSHFNRLFIPFGIAVLVSYLVQNFFVFDTFGSYLMFFVFLAFIDSMSGHRNKTESLATTLNLKNLKVAVLLLFVAALALVYFVNYKILYANNRQYWGLNYFLNRMPVEALESYAAALMTKHPYINQTRRDFAASLSQVYSQGLKIPDVEKVVSKAMEELALAIKSQPNDYFTKVSFADYSTIFYVFDKNYIKLGEEAALKALEISPKRQQVYYALAKLKVIQGKKEESLDLMKKAVELDSEVGDPHFFYAFMAFETGDLELGFKELELANKLGREYKSAGEARVIANYYADAGDYHEASLYYQRALGVNPEDLESKLKLGIVYFYNGRKDLAKEKISQVIMAMPDFVKSENFQKIQPIVEILGIAF